MPIIVNPEEISITRQGDGWVEMTLADAGKIGVPAMVARRWVLEPNGRGPMLVQGNAEQLLYVIRGNGVAIINQQEELFLDHESVLWVEPGETYQFVAGTQGLEILQGYAPGD